MKISIKKDKDSYTAIDGRTNEVIIITKNYDELASTIYKNAVHSYSSGDLNKFKTSYFRKIINLVDKKQNLTFYLGENISMKKSELKNLIHKVIKEETSVNYNYLLDQLDNAEKEHDWTYKMQVKFVGSKNSSKFLSITQDQFDAIKKLLSSKVATQKISKFADKV